MKKNTPIAVTLPAREDGETVTEWVARTYAVTDHDRQAAEFLEYFEAVIERAGEVIDYVNVDGSG